jgi:hypothetical protein
MVKEWFESNGLEVIIKPKQFIVKKDGKVIFQRQVNSFFRSSHLESYVNQVAKLLNIPNDFDVKNYQRK